MLFSRRIVGLDIFIFCPRDNVSERRWSTSASPRRERHRSFLIAEVKVPGSQAGFGRVRLAFGDPVRVDREVLFSWRPHGREGGALGLVLFAIVLLVVAVNQFLFDTVMALGTARRIVTPARKSSQVT